MDQSEAAKLLGISLRSARRLASEGKLSRRALPNKRVQYQTVDVERMKGLFLMQRDGTPVLRRDPPPLGKLNPGAQGALMANAVARLIEAAEERREGLALPTAPACPHRRAGPRRRRRLQGSARGLHPEAGQRAPQRAPHPALAHRGLPGGWQRLLLPAAAPRRHAADD